MSLTTRVTDLAQAFGARIKALTTSSNAMQVKVAGAGRMVSSFAGGVLPGLFYDQSFGCTAASTVNPRVTMDAVPFMVPRDLKIDQLGVTVTTAQANSKVRLAIYAAGTDGWPGALLLDTGVIATTATGYAFATVNFTFTAGKEYWLSIKATTPGTMPTIRGIAAAATRSMGITGATSVGYLNIVGTTAVGGADAAFADPFPAMQTGFAVSVSAQPSFRMRAAA